MKKAKETITPFLRLSIKSVHGAKERKSKFPFIIIIGLQVKG